MAIRKDLDDMLNNLKSGNALESPNKPKPKTIPRLSDRRIDNMSVDDIVTSINGNGNKAAEPVASHKKRIVISHELPDYEAIRAEEQKKQKLEAERRAAEKAELARREAERRAAEEAELARREAERRAAEKAELARREAERKAAEEAELARREAERKAAEEAELARREAERKAAEEAEFARLEAERMAAEEAELSKYETETSDFTSSTEDPFAEEAVPTASNSFDDEKQKAIDELDRQYIEEMLGLNKEPFWKKLFSKKKKEQDDAEASEAPAEKKQGKLSSMLHNILEEDPNEIINQRKEQLENGDEPSNKSGLKKGFYAVFGVIFGVLACIGLVAVIGKCVSMFGSYTSGDSKKEEFESAIYPAVVMDIESFATPDELPSDQIITAAIWSMIMNEDVTKQYELTFDVVIIPAADVESYAVKLFGDELPKLEHTTVGPAESRFYYNEETKSYNVPVAPVTYTYTPEVREATKSGNEYTVTVDYIDELPSWLPKTSSKSVEYVLVEDNGSYRIKSMKILSTNTSGV